MWCPFYYSFSSGDYYKEDDLKILVINSFIEFQDLIAFTYDEETKELYRNRDFVDYDNQSIVAIFKKVPHHVISILSERIIENEDHSLTIDLELSAFEDQLSIEEHFFLYLAVVPKIENTQEITFNANWVFDYEELPVFNAYCNSSDPTDPSFIDFYIKYDEEANGSNIPYIKIINSIEILQEEVAFNQGIPELFNEIDFETQSILIIEEEGVSSMHIDWEITEVALAEKAGKKIVYINLTSNDNVCENFHNDYLFVIPKTDEYSATEIDVYNSDSPITFRSYIPYEYL